MSNEIFQIKWGCQKFLKMNYIIVILAIAVTCRALPEVDDLEGEADFRSITLHWRYRRWVTPAYGFMIKYCEDQAWGKHRCKVKNLKDVAANEIPSSDFRHREFVAILSGLRMATNYTIEVTPVEDGQEYTTGRARAMGSEIHIQTKGFSARAINCLANSSIVEVDTGPNFGGLISVEGSDDPRCIVQGKKTDSKTRYQLKINHALCGSEVRNASILTFILVQENLPILTHSTRRFMVVCTYVPDTFTVRAGVNLPEDLDKKDELVPVDHSLNEVDPSELFDAGASFFGKSIGSQVGEALHLSAEDEQQKPQMWAHLVLMVVLIMAAVIGLSLAVWHFVKHSRTQSRTGFMSPQMEPSAVEVDNRMEAVVRDFAGGMGDHQPVEEPPVALVSVKPKVEETEA